MKNFLSILILLALVSCKKNEAPLCQINSPNDNELFISTDFVSVNVDAIDTDGIINEVRLYLNDVGLTSIQLWPYDYTFPIKEYDAGENILKAIAIDNEGMETSDEVTIHFGELPEVRSDTISFLKYDSATINGSMNSSVGTLIEKGFYWGTASSPATTGLKVLSESDGNTFSLTLSDLTADTKYFYIAFATTNFGTSFGNELSFITLNTSTTTDIEGNVYNTILIGDQWWMAENLKTSHYNDESLIIEETDANNWEINSVAAYCWYNNDKESFGEIYGALYNFYAVETGKLCPEGWHVPSDQEWKQLEIFLGMSVEDSDIEFWRGTNQGSKIAGHAHLWVEGPLTYDTDFSQSNFNAIPSGYREFDGTFKGIGENGHWWPSTETSNSTAWDRDLNYQKTCIYRNNDDKRGGISVRCIMN